MSGTEEASNVKVYGSGSSLLLVGESGIVEALVCQREKIYWKGRGRRRVRRALWRDDERRGRDGRCEASLGGIWCCESEHWGGEGIAIEVDISH